MILRCTCNHDTQDKLHGEGMRVHNLAPKQGGDEYHCTICGTKRTAGGSSSDDKKKSKKK